MEAKQTLSGLRRDSGISQEELAERLGVSRQTVSRWENGASAPSAENLAKLSEVFHVPAEAFLKDGWTPPEQAEPEVQVVEVPVPQPRNYRLWALLGALTLTTGILLGALFFGERDTETVLQSKLEGEVVDNLADEEFAPLLPLNENSIPISEIESELVDIPEHGGLNLLPQNNYNMR